MVDFPRKPAEVDAGWLEARLRESGVLRDARVTDMAWVPIGTGQVGDTARFTLTYDREGAGPATVAGKFASADQTSRGTAATLQLYTKEVTFYREVAGLLDARVPRTFAAEVDENGQEFVLLFEDLAPERGGNQLLGCSIDDARAAIRQAAAIHAPSRNHPAILGQPCFQPQPALTGQMAALYPQAHAVFRERYDGQLAPELMRICDELNDLIGGWFGRVLPDPGLVHGDFRLDNMLFGVGNGAEPIAIVDWQTTGIGCGLTDVGYFMGCGIGSALRRPHEDELLDLYCAEMSRRGVPTTREAIWTRYRLGALHGVSTAVFSAAFVVRTPRGDENFLSMATGACELALDHDSIGALRHFLETGAC
ncbi:phosphotransferase [Novosphingobium sp. EMRT-2]|uniref:phosphotransferase n=1 Tax=Novosphingobium sp. EMRT-2 TaxID=2571749 RepID=UPI0010BE0A53|nr:phosphotransferase [Novosphingobium sp. EMRT-2]QCI92808.1 DUF1679 domain-containing protein [Novosphingobium sp. EMRT-2]